VIKRLREIGNVLLAMLREIFDESAYRRFLVRKQVVSSCTAYAEFARENELLRARRPRCC
jgi:hypothetical protein